MTRKANTNSAIILLLGALAAIVFVAVGISSCQEDMGLAQPSTGTIAAVAELNEAQRVLAAGESYEGYALALRVAVASYDGMVLHNAADTKVRATLKGSVECLRAAREAWQAQVEGEWAEETYGSPEYWRAAHPSAELDLPEGELAADDVIAAALSCAEGGLAEASEMVGGVGGP